MNDQKTAQQAGQHQQFASIKSKIIRQIAAEVDANRIESGKAGKLEAAVYYAKGSHLKTHYSKGSKPVFVKGKTKKKSK
jgi:hypothetical protein